MRKLVLQFNVGGSLLELELLPGLVAVVGSSEDCALTLNDPQVAAQHLELKLDGEFFYVRDMDTGATRRLPQGGFFVENHFPLVDGQLHLQLGSTDLLMTWTTESMSGMGADSSEHTMAEKTQLTESSPDHTQTELTPTEDSLASPPQKPLQSTNQPTSNVIKFKTPSIDHRQESWRELESRRRVVDFPATDHGQSQSKAVVLNEGGRWLFAGLMVLVSFLGVYPTIVYTNFWSLLITVGGTGVWWDFYFLWTVFAEAYLGYIVLGGVILFALFLYAGEGGWFESHVEVPKRLGQSLSLLLWTMALLWPVVGSLVLNSNYKIGGVGAQMVRVHREFSAQPELLTDAANLYARIQRQSLNFEHSSLYFLFINQLKERQVLNVCVRLSPTDWEGRKNCLLQWAVASAESYVEARPLILKDVAAGVIVLKVLDGLHRGVLRGANVDRDRDYFLKVLDYVGLEQEKQKIIEVWALGTANPSTRLNQLDELRTTLEARIKKEFDSLKLPKSYVFRLADPLLGL